MSTLAETALELKSPESSPPHLRPARLDDHEGIVQLQKILSPKAPSADDWRMLWHGSPLWPQIGKRWPLGWVLETADRGIVGCLGNIPLLYRFRGEPVIAASGRGWVVAPEYRGFALWLLDERFNQRGVDLFMDTTINPDALDAFIEFSNRVPAGDWEAIAYCITDYRAFATRALRKLNVPLAQELAPSAAAALRLKDAIFAKKLPKPRSSLVIEAADRFDSRFNTFWHELLRQNGETLLAARDSATLSWHFALPLRSGRLWILTASRNRQMRAYCIFLRQETTQDVRRVRLVDYQTIDRDVDALPDLLRVALRRCITEDVCVLNKPGVGLAKMRAFDEFAPYRGRQTWPLFYRAVDPALDIELRQPRCWDPSEYDGDSSIE
jgi:hypothetical protein